MRKLAIISVLIAIMDVGIPYLFLRDKGSFFGSFLFWVSLAFLVLVASVWHVNQWGD